MAENSDFKILVVDDVPRNIQVLGNILVQEKYNISFATNGEDAIKIAQDSDLDLILLDVMMPGIDGFETCTRLKDNPATQHIPVIFMTALTETTDKITGFEKGAVDYITKPYEAGEVLARVKTHLRIRKLEKDLNQRIKDLEVRNNFIRRTFGRYLSDEVVENLLESPDGLTVGGDNSNVTILMSDIRGFSSITETLTPHQVVQMLNMYLSKMTDVIIDYEGTIDEFIGDAILVIFGAPVEQTNHAERAVACALAMQAKMIELNEEYSKEGFPRIQMGIGINTGEVIVGNIGSQKRAKYGVVGRNVNIASRIESYTVGNQVLVSELTKDSIKSDLKIKKEIKVNPKGVAAPIKLFDIESIGSPYNVSKPTGNESFYALEDDIKCEYIVLDEKSADHIAQKGKIVNISGYKAIIILEDAVPVFSNLKIVIADPTDNSSLNLYAKIIESEDTVQFGYKIHFTHLPEKANDFFGRFIVK